jgi:integrase
MTTRYPKQGKGLPWTVKELKAVPSDWHGDYLNDGGGLVGEVRAGKDGKVTIAFKYAFRFGSKIDRFYCGTWPATPLEVIRRARDEARSTNGRGVNPNDQRKAERIEAQAEVAAVLEADQELRAQQRTVGDLFNAWIADGVLRKDGNAELKRAFEKDVIPAIGLLPLKDVTVNDLNKCVKSVVTRGADRMAVRIYNDLVQMFAWGEKVQPWRKLLIEGNPAAVINIKNIVSAEYDLEEVRTRTLDPNEIRELRDILNRLEGDYKEAERKYDAPRPLDKVSQLAIWICLSTLCRIGELLMAEWKHIDFNAGTWYIPKENAKGARGKKQEQTVYLSSFAINQFKALYSITGNKAAGGDESGDPKGKWCFPARLVASHLDLKTISKQIGDRQIIFTERKEQTRRQNNNTLVLANGKNGNWTPHDLRRTGATMMQELKIPLDTIDRCLNHAMSGPKVRAAYFHHDYADEKRDAWAAVGARLDEILSQKE